VPKRDAVSLTVELAAELRAPATIVGI
jgi:hypothetical protein